MGLLGIHRGYELIFGLMYDGRTRTLGRLAAFRHSYNEGPLFCVVGSRTPSYIGEKKAFIGKQMTLLASFTFHVLVQRATCLY
jgi:hypothetical protein